MVETLYLSEESTIFYYFSVKDRIIAHTNDDLETIDAVSCYDGFNTFKQLQDNEIQRLKENNQLSWYIH